jgi:ABC-2 type transport system permease protein
MLSLPVEILLGRLSGAQLFSAVGVQALWLVLFIGVYRLLWRVGLKHYSAVGA